jgi:hypothetical protein
VIRNEMLSPSKFAVDGDNVDVDAALMGSRFSG